MDLDWVICPHCGNVQEEDCDNDGFVCDECDEPFHYERPDNEEDASGFACGDGGIQRN